MSEIQYWQVELIPQYHSTHYYRFIKSTSNNDDWIKFLEEKIDDESECPYFVAIDKIKKSKEDVKLILAKNERRDGYCCTIFDKEMNLTKLQQLVSVNPDFNDNDELFSHILGEDKEGIYIT
jgi:hypothetical protein